jgi:hypothetical protein
MTNKMAFVSMILLVLSVLLSPFFLLHSVSFAERMEPLIIDHTCTDISQIPEYRINKAKACFRISYGHTSHGSQIVTGMNLLKGAAGSLYWFDRDGTNNGLSLHDYEPAGDLGNPNRTEWYYRTRNLLDTSGCDRNLIMWSWCGQVSSASYNDIAVSYLNNMDKLETDYPNVTFIYMTGHLDGTGEDGQLNIRNKQIRDYCIENNKILFDFADIESYDPDGNYFLDKGADDACNYNGGNWADEWCAANPGECESCSSCAHSRCLNCQLKGRAFWYMIASLVSCPGDFDGDRDVDGSDMAVFAADYGRTNCNMGDPCEGDFDVDGDVDSNDLAIFATDFGKTDCP